VTAAPIRDVPLPGAGTKHAELVAFRVSEHDPRLLSLPNICSRGAKHEKAFDLQILVVGPEVEVKPVLGLLTVGDMGEQEPGKAICGWSDLELVRVVVDDHPPEGFSPPVPEYHRVPCIDNRLLPFEAHDAIVETTREAGRTTFASDGSSESAP
jgi:hypothetical protein